MPQCIMTLLGSFARHQSRSSLHSVRTHARGQIRWKTCRRQASGNFLHPLTCTERNLQLHDIVYLVLEFRVNGITCYLYDLARDSRTGSAEAAAPVIKAPIVTSSHALEPAVRRHVARDLAAANDCYADAAID
jgi:hypothetical protein